ncbi:MAG: hypothetical protein LIO53_04395 [Oscillospiraceae bacterium]|nr:hypothetical protein [Oscillospiraceae bacterium]
MAREARKMSISGNYYVVLKGEELFVTEEDKKKFLEILEKNFATGIVHGSFLAQGEIRLVVKEGEKGISMAMKSVTTSYARYFNRTHNREGKLFSGRFASEPLETDGEIEEKIKTLQSGEVKPKKRPAVRKTQKPTPKPLIKEEKKAEPKKEEKKKNLPSWLL